MTGLVGLAIFGPSGVEDPEQIMPLVAMTVFPPVIGALCITGAIAAMLSSADSMLVLTSSEFTENILKPVIMKGKKLDPKKELAISRIVTLIVGLAAVGLAFLLPSAMVYTVVSFAWASMGNPFAVVTCCTLFWDKYTGKAAFWTMVFGFFGTVLWQISPMNSVIDARLVGLFPALFAAWFFSVVSKPENA
jgi:sodium/proline symporter